MSAEHPFNRMPLKDGEELVVKSWNPTFTDHLTLPLQCRTGLFTSGDTDS